MSTDAVERIVKRLSRLRFYRKKFSGVAPLRLVFRIYERKLRYELQDHWRSMYVLLENGDYHYIPRELDRHGFAILTHPPTYEAVIPKFCRPGTTAIDVGANIGQWAVPMSKAVGERGQLLAFEPIPVMCAALNKTFQVNGLFHAHAFEFALSERSGTADFFINLRNDKLVDSGFSSLERCVQGATQIKVKTITLDEFVASQCVAAISFIKIDVEGHEYAVLKGAKNVLSTHRPVLVIETGHENKEYRERTHDFFYALGYNLVGILYADSIVPADWATYRSTSDPFGRWPYVNLLLIPHSGNIPC
jgi:FkbM family methyltransferase